MTDDANTIQDASGMPGGYRNFDAVAEDYDSSRYLPPEIQEKAAHLLRNVAGLSAGDVLLDAGVGTGRFALPLAQTGVTVVGVDISEKMLARLQAKRAAADVKESQIPSRIETERTHSRLDLRLIRGDLRAIPLRSNVAKAALTVHILHLIVEWQKVINEIRRVLQSEGTLLLAWQQGRPLHGEGRQRSRLIPTREHYFALARQRGLIRPPIGAAGGDAIREYLASTGAQIEEVDTGDLYWKFAVPVSSTLEQLQHRTWSTLWDVPDADHAELMAETKDWVRQTYDSVDVTEEAEATLCVMAARWL